ncbi:hypothetical protein H0R92_12710 [Treponema sp. OMZ 840]|uniref:hypothetical protein n=1 Tax=Treponema sp. OMZ 840 TaxID=244313 RepID=UPI003D904CAF
MNKKNLLFTAAFVYELLRLLFILAVQAEYSEGRLPLSWYAAVPLLSLPFFLLYTMYTKHRYAAFAAQLYVLIKTAGIAGFLFFMRQTLVQSGVLFRQSGTNVFQTLIYMMPFFTIDVILSVALMVKRYKEHGQTEGEPCK